MALVMPHAIVKPLRPHFRCISSRLSRRWGGEVKPVEGPHKGKYTVAVVGGGSAGVSVASSLLRKLPEGKTDVAIIEPADTHYYQAGWTMVGGLGVNASDTAMPMGAVLPPGVDRLKTRCDAFEPDANALILSDGTALHYDVLIVAAGIQSNFHEIKGLEDTLGENGVSSIYSYAAAPYLWKTIDQMQGGRMLFTNPSTPVKCGGAPLKIAMLAESRWRSKGIRASMDISYHSGGAVCFGIPFYSEGLEKMFDERNIGITLNRNLVEVDGPARRAKFRLPSGEEVVEEFDMLHVTPPMSAPDFISGSSLANDSGFVSVDDRTCQHTKFSNVFSLGDCSSLPTSKTYSAVAAQSPVVVQNVSRYLAGDSRGVSYNGYTACPILVGDNKLLLAEFNGYTKQPECFLPFVNKLITPNPIFYLMKRYVFPFAYWNFTPIGRWFGKHTVFEPTLEKDATLRMLPASSKAAVIEQLFDEESCTYTYVVACPTTLRALIIDPVWGKEHEYLELLRERGWQLDYSLETHVHADHITGAMRLKACLPELQTGISGASGAVADMFMAHKQSIQIGDVTVEGRRTPGHTDGCMTFVVHGKEGAESVAFTGDALLIGGCGRTDFQQGSPESLYNSVYDQIFSLPDDTILYPGHDYKGRKSSTVGLEKATNPRLTHAVEEFTDIMENLKLAVPKKLDVAVPANLVGGSM
eukprot:TRINITY_DN61742_c0_g1_i1.p1 TRINITY_DN61742_c0_g1~~TRINITY_DN61742_c0_g1_i1.p1  ORF type:complete len:723 (+),score=119.98 TRINITY_DN61742_c0_g1_i1:84-2171(+)